MERLYKRILLKLSGELLMGNQEFGINPTACQKVAAALAALKQEGIEIGVVIGGGNIFRGIRLEGGGMERTAADQMGMLATIMNGLALQNALRDCGCPALAMSALDCPKVVESYQHQRALQALSDGTVLIFVGGTGNPYFTTDTAAALRACEIHADLLMKATKVDGIYDKDPLKYSNAKKYDVITYSQVLAEQLEVMDATSIALCRSNQLPIFVFNMDLLLAEPQLAKILLKSQHGTFVKAEAVK